VISGEFNSQEVANTLWAFATMGRKPGERMMGLLEGRAEVMSGDFNSQNVANTLWAFWTLGTKPGERMMGLLEQRAEVISVDFNSQEVAITLWSMCFLRMHRSVVQCDLISSLVSAASRLGSKFCSGLNMQQLRQVHQFFITCDMEESLSMRLPASIYALKANHGPACKAAFLAEDDGATQPSASQQLVSDTLRDMRLLVEDEFRCPKSGYSIDMRVHDMRVHDERRHNTSDLGLGWAIEYDGPSHFLACKAPTGATLIKRRHLQLLGYKLVSLPFWEWDTLSCRSTETKAGIDERRKYLEAKLKVQCNVGGDSVAATSREALPPPLPPRYQPLRC
jgi:hypothetical protein